MNRSFRYILESTKETIERLWESLDDLAISHMSYTQQYANLILVLADAYEELGTEENDYISKGLKWLISNNKYAICMTPSLHFFEAGDRDIPSYLPRVILDEMKNYKSYREVYINTIYYSSHRDAMMAAAIAAGRIT